MRGLIGIAKRRARSQPRSNRLIYIVAYFLLINFTLGQVSYEVSGPFVGVDPMEALQKGAINRTAFPRVVRVASIGRWEFERAFEFGLSVTLAVLEKLYWQMTDADADDAQKQLS